MNAPDPSSIPILEKSLKHDPLHIDLIKHRQKRRGQTIFDDPFEKGIERWMPDRQAEYFLEVFNFLNILLPERTLGII
jgi:hypothetical protein